MTDSTPADSFWGEPIHTYTRAEALADGVLFDVTQTAREVGFRVPVALTASVWADVCDLSGRYVSRDPGQSPEGRLWDLLFMAAHAARRRENRNASAFVYALIMPVGAGLLVRNPVPNRSVAWPRGLARRPPSNAARDEPSPLVS